MLNEFISDLFQIKDILCCFILEVKQRLVIRYTAGS